MVRTSRPAILKTKSGFVANRVKRASNSILRILYRKEKKNQKYPFTPFLPDLFVAFHSATFVDGSNDAVFSFAGNRNNGIATINIVIPINRNPIHQQPTQRGSVVSIPGLSMKKNCINAVTVRVLAYVLLSVTYRMDFHRSVDKLRRKGTRTHPQSTNKPPIYLFDDMVCTKLFTVYNFRAQNILR